MILEQPTVRFEAIHSILSSDGNILTISELCETAGVSRSDYYRWLSAAGTRENELISVHAAGACFLSEGSVGRSTAQRNPFKTVVFSAGAYYGFQQNENLHELCRN